MTASRFPLEPIEKASIDELRALQLERLQKTLAHAYAHSPVYQAKFDAAGVHPDDCKTLADLARFPFTTKADLRDSYPFGMFAVPREQVVRIHASSGTTGKPTVVGYTRNDINTWASVVARSIRAAGARPGSSRMSSANASHAARKRRAARCVASAGVCSQSRMKPATPNTRTKG